VDDHSRLWSGGRVGVALGARKLDIILKIAIEGIAMYAVFAYVERNSTRWAFRSSMSAGA
jgi:hypothetical protein